MIEPSHDLPVARQAKVLNLSRSSIYYRPRPVSPEDLALMRRIDELHLERPFAGARMLRDFLNREGVAVGRRHVATLMRRMGIEAIYRRRNTSKPAPGHKIYPYLLRGVKVDRPNHVWATGYHLYPEGARLRLSRRRRRLVHPARAFPSGLDHDGRRLLHRSFARGHRQIRQEAIGKYGKPQIFNSDQGSPFTSEAFTGVSTAERFPASVAE